MIVVHLASDASSAELDATPPPSDRCRTSFADDRKPAHAILLLRNESWSLTQ